MARYGRKGESEEEWKIRHAAKCHAWRQVNKLKYNSYQNEYQRLWRARNKRSAKKTRLKWRVRNRFKVLSFFGRKCKFCGFSDWRALQVDHINGEGKKDEHYKACVGTGLRTLIKLIESRPDFVISRYQLLCANCNWIKRYLNDELPGNGKAVGWEGATPELYSEVIAELIAEGVWS